MARTLIPRTISVKQFRAGGLTIGKAMTEQIEKRRQILLRAHQSAFGSKSSAIRFAVAPYRICPLGAHVDHQLGLVTGLTIDSGILLAYTPSSEPRARLTSLNFPGTMEFEFGSIPPASPGD